MIPHPGQMNDAFELAWLEYWLFGPAFWDNNEEDSFLMGGEL